MKKIYILLVGILGFGISSCDDFLNELPTEAIAEEEAFTSVKDFSNNLNGVYNEMGNYRLFGRDVICLGDAASDIVFHSASSGHFLTLSEWQVQSTEIILEDIWNYGYKVINNSSRIIQAGETVDLPETSEIDGYVAQAYGLRALTTFALTNIFALPYTDANKSTLGIVNISTPVEVYQEVSRSTLGENYTHILSDIAKAKEYFGKEDVEDPGSYYMNLNAVYALEARVKLYMKDYAGAIAAANEAIDLRGGSLANTPDAYTSLFTSNSISQEDIFTLVKSAADHPGANSLGTMYTLYGLSIPAAILSQYPETDIRTSILSEYGAKYSGTSEGADASNIGIFRLPELYLILAESYAAQGNYAEAKENLLVISLARNPGLDAASIPENSQIVSFIRQERKLELIQEGHRYFDVRRWQEKITVGRGKYQNYDPSLFAYPIPQAEINSGFGIVQTEGWDRNLPK
ncbi:membrane protein [Bacteroidia bacterium]|nr:membrane protein [Bacteroidia bacterium]GHU83447.1 membrane protein [Bacteroidia bacterium]